MKGLLLPVGPRWSGKIFGGEKNIDVRKRCPNLFTPFPVMIYETKAIQTEHYDGCDVTYCGRGKVIGMALCDKIYDEREVVYNYFDAGMTEIGRKDKSIPTYSEIFIRQSCLNLKEIEEYSEGLPLFGLHFSTKKLFEKPRGLGTLTAWRDCETLERYFKHCKFGYAHPTHCKYCRLVKRPPQSWQYIDIDLGDLKWISESRER